MRLHLVGATAQTPSSACEFAEDDDLQAAEFHVKLMLFAAVQSIEPRINTFLFLRHVVYF